MCGIVGIVGTQPVAERILDCLKRLEYRGYDSAGIAALNQRGELHRRRAEGKLNNLGERLELDPLPGRIGMGHTRWATHGAPTEGNAHPHVSADVGVVHNGIIENFRELREELSQAGFAFTSQTDTETVAHLVRHEIAGGLAPIQAAHAAIQRLRGAFALAIMFGGHDDLIVAARNGPPLAVGFGDGETYLGSDAVALASLTNRITYLEDGDWAVLRRDGIELFDTAGSKVERPIQISSGSSLMAEKGNYRHFMLKEMYEQPEVVGHTLARYIDFTTDRIRPLTGATFDFANVDRITIAACGTAYLAGCIAKYWFERYARLPVDVDIASELRYRDAPPASNGLSLFISQSGETADTLACLTHAQANGQQTAAVVNVQESTIGRQADNVFPTLAGPEIGVASTKAFTCQLAVLASLAIAAGVARDEIDGEQERRLVNELAEAPRLMTDALKLDDRIDSLGSLIAGRPDALYLGRDTNFPLALEGALKLKEISYIHAEGYAAGELKHGPIALVDDKMPVIVIAPHDRVFEKTVSNMQEVAARGGRILLITDRRGEAAAGLDDIETIVLDDAPELISPLIYSVPIQLLAYHVAVQMGTDVDQPRNLAKSVTVE